MMQKIKSAAPGAFLMTPSCLVTASGRLLAVAAVTLIFVTTGAPIQEEFTSAHPQQAHPASPHDETVTAFASHTADAISPHEPYLTEQP